MLLKVPLDIVPPEELPNLIDRLLPPPESAGDAEQSRGRDIVLLSLWDLLRARRNGEYRNYVFNAALVLPISKSLVSGARFLTGKKVVRYMPFNFVIGLLSLLEKKEYPLYLLGATSRVLKKAEKNIHSTFPRLRIVGRREASMRKHEEPAVIEAIRKASPSLLLAGKGIRGGELWIARNSGRLNSGFRLWCSDLFAVFAEKKRRPSDAVFDKGLESIGFCLRNPLKFLRIFPYFRYKLLLLVYKIFKR
jgi:N-acetylglucosaminyldiphosphoundecaprenol N-acetyl-beta-D-mannosaminyltransferase